MKKLSSMFMMALLLFGSLGSVIAADDQSTSKSVSKTKVGYFEDLFDRVLLALTFNEEKKAERSLKMADKRLREIENFAGEDSEKLKKSQERYNTLVLKAEGSLEKLEVAGEDTRASNVRKMFEFHDLKADAIYTRISDNLEENGANSAQIQELERAREDLSAKRTTDVKTLKTISLGNSIKGVDAGLKKTVETTTNNKYGEKFIIRDLVQAILNSDLKEAEKDELIALTKDYLESREDDGEDLCSRDLSFLRIILERIQGLEGDAYDALRNRIRNFMNEYEKVCTSSGDDDSDDKPDYCERDLSFIRDLIDRINSLSEEDMNARDKYKLIQRIRNFLEVYSENCNDDKPSYCERDISFIRDILERTENMDKRSEEYKTLITRIRNFHNSYVENCSDDSNNDYGDTPMPGEPIESEIGRVRNVIPVPIEVSP